MTCAPRRTRFLPIAAGLAVMAAGGLTACGTSTARQHPAAAPLEQTAEQVQQAIATVWPRLGEIWPGADFSDHNLLLTDGRSVWEADRDHATRVEEDKVRAEKIKLPQRGGFDVITWQGKHSLIVRVAQGKELGQLRQDPLGLTSPSAAMHAFELATHEQFHPYVQNKDGKTWKSLAKLEAAGSGDREELYPLRAAPRIERAMIYNTLLDAAKDPGRARELLTKTAWWRQKYQSDHREEADSPKQVDLLEGTTKYVEQTALSMALAGDRSGAGDLRKATLSRLKPMKTAFKGVEPYAIGTAALLAADAQGKNLKTRLTQDPTTPLDALLEGVEPAPPQKVPDDVRQGVTAAVDKTNKQLAQSIDPFVKAIQDHGTRVLMLPVDKVSGSVGGSGFYTTEELPISITPEARATFSLPSGTMTLAGVTAGQMEQDGTGYFAVPLSADAKVTSDRLTVKAKNLHGSIAVQAKDDDGQTFLYAR
ncbi:hypothetical protein [Streptomyces sp. Je 1-332]|uniref:hypothetical protein n=1 Tax=Streptomyces sp. Je 1-332 TaxID=3231270 RepID=UPI00345A2024